MYKEVFKTWLESDMLTEAEKAELNALAENEKDVEFAFGKDLEFGTAGMRGVIGLGTNKMNVYAVKRATQGLAEYISALGESAKNQGVVISYDTRRMSYEFAYAAAVVLVSNGIKTFLFSDVHPVPMLSYAVRELKTKAGIMITASHNPKEYNGYKVYGEDGSQMSPEATAKVVEYINGIGGCLSNKIAYDESLDKKIIIVKKSLDKKYYKKIKALCLSPKEVKKIGKDIKLVYTPVHGSGYVPVTTILKKLGIKATLVPEQLNKDTEFSTVQVPNPEYKETLSLAIKMAEFKEADVVFGTDPDCDRLGVALKNNSGEFVALSGNQTGILLLDYVLRRLKETGKLGKKGFVVKSFVSTGMAKLICDDYGVELFETPVGFKFIGEKIKELDDTGLREFVFGFEESCGYLRGTHARDKDAVVASMLFAEMVCYYTYHGIGVFERLSELYDKYGYVYDTNVSVGYSGLNAMQEMTAVVDKIKNSDVKKIGGFDVFAKRDYSSLKRTDKDGGVTDIKSASANAVYFETENGFVCVRPSGTEPKLKVYYSINSVNEETAKKDFEKMKEDFETLLYERKEKSLTKEKAVKEKTATKSKQTPTKEKTSSSKGTASGSKTVKKAVAKSTAAKKTVKKKEEK